MRGSGEAWRTLAGVRALRVETFTSWETEVTLQAFVNIWGWGVGIKGELPLKPGPP